MAVDLDFVWTAVGGAAKSHVEDWPTWKLFVVVVVSGAVGSLVAFSPAVFPVIAFASHFEAPYDVAVTEYTDSGYGSIIQLHTGVGGAGSNATFSTANGALGFTIKPSKTESGLDSFALDPTTPHNLTFAEVSVDFNLSAHTYEFRLRDASHSENQSIRRHWPHLRLPLRHSLIPKTFTGHCTPPIPSGPPHPESWGNSS